MTNQDGSGSAKPKTLSTTVISGATGVTAGFCFSLLPDVNKVLQNTNTASAWLYTLTFISLIMLLILVTGYVLLQRDTQSRTAPVMWVGLSVFALLPVIGFASIIIVQYREPSVTVHAYLGSGSDVGSLEDNPPLKLAAYLNSDPKKYTLTTDKDDAKTLSFKDNDDLTVDIQHFNTLMTRFAILKGSQKDVKSREHDAPGIANFIKKACKYVPVNADIYQQCATMTRGPEASIP